MLDLLKFDITAQDRSASAFGRIKNELGGVKGALAGVNDYARRAGRSMRNAGAGLSAAVTAPLAFLGKESVQLYDQQVQAETAVQQALKSTGGAAGRTADELKGLASALQGATTFGDEDILRNVTAPLLTFTKVQGDVFDRAQANVLDMATLLKMDLKSASILVGKALNDPVKGISALSRSGVQFSESQKGVIKSLVETGDVAGAQALILQELESQFQGQAAAAAASPLGQWRQLSNAIGDVKEELGAQIVPFLKPVVESVKEGVEWFAALDPEVKRNVVVFGGLAAVIGPIVGALGLVSLGVSGIATAFGGLTAVLLANPIVAAIAAVAGGAYLIYRNWDGISAWFAQVWEGLRGVFSAGWEGLKSLLLNYTAPGLIYQNWGSIAEWFEARFAQVRTAFSIAWSGIKGILSGQYSPSEMIYSLWSGIGSWFSALAPQLTAAFTDLWEAIRAEVAQWGARFVAVGSDIVQGMIDGIKQKWVDLKSTVADLGSGVAQTVKDMLGIRSPSRVFKGIGRDVVAGLGLGIRENSETALGEIEALTQGLIAAGRGAAEAGGEIDGVKTGVMGSLQDLRSGAQQVFKDVLGNARGFKDSLSSVLDGLANRVLSSGIDALFGAIWPNAKGNAFSGGRVTAFANGGVVASPTLFPMRGGTGLMGEAGPEAILPLARGSDGRLGVQLQSGGGAGGGGSGARVDLVVHAAEGVTVEQAGQIAGNVALRLVQASAKAQRQQLRANVLTDSARK
ncbi:phage tail length tape measure family protein [Leisingera caerulea]|uniref:Phage tail length tape measure family protein n=1 Tax=Leisingera caerulea TaxID=506591 RepID=A0ABY5X074_LEICA|nr:phage tail length tape measure family protein [Leisingera caerulea]UWQ59967.1 phage tail length tape measure family protein [Leisingera caerulea]